MLDFEQSLLFRQADFRRRVEAFSRAKTTLVDAGIADGSLDSDDWARLLTLERRASEELDSVSDALDRLRCGSFGVCQNCGEPIAFALLERRPWAALCELCDTGNNSRRGS